MASRFATVSKDEILVVTETAAPKSTKKETKFGLSLFNLRQNRKKKVIPDTVS